ncbi:hypothetical protein A3A76_05560 [Candidatus Woesebacteria bacterium RIFCSPLOWO2_01_FULL_39_23]|uniref:Uncharacterized protein n=1 Tax=Candidatus Woesebacteria bacterium RIFCSPHIGHO2_01_FULL_40_22 TaxID=1802499 RepID=A0A1F7YKP6_9BACT|nr:MAG: hypothetical protein A2141_03750 [Candidatus Woesebacteria bacterium RBG_16_40_11]OGM27921.1 MAG: hypothetical protein A2628_03485 [Candidatus Woesebacteria bacterium RIFCSPHIGHO2_01_FULL_40_22]OGM37525.1 MAG: hypothetical protein A3E41_01710 [Candidatus Woesebacteria bacterium RIFCSPHIGHO2_12_FULL_38_9]OGM61677.1 MAG: hypothetical protein A3A76_05560 [Candidatus Woesebacteria bacterium RIFCSPLOWO2_01_FULL_39_23]
MAIRRTRKQKESARHNFEISWQPEAKNERLEASVNRQNKQEGVNQHKSSSPRIKSVESVNYKEIALIKKDLLKSLIVASLILGIETVLYLLWS